MLLPNVMAMVLWTEFAGNSGDWFRMGVDCMCRCIWPRTMAFAERSVAFRVFLRNPSFVESQCRCNAQQREFRMLRSCWPCKPVKVSNALNPTIYDMHQCLRAAPLGNHHSLQDQEDGDPYRCCSSPVASSLKSDAQFADLLGREVFADCSGEQRRAVHLRPPSCRLELHMHAAHPFIDHTSSLDHQTTTHPPPLNRDTQEKAKKGPVAAVSTPSSAVGVRARIAATSKHSSSTTLRHRKAETANPVITRLHY